MDEVLPEGSTEMTKCKTEVLAVKANTLPLQAFAGIKGDASVNSDTSSPYNERKSSFETLDDR